MMILRGAMAALLASGLIACSNGNTNGVTDGGIYDSGPLVDGLANVWVDPDGCQHWYIDDGTEGFMTPRLRPDGTHMCRETREAIIMKDGTQIYAEPEPTVG